MVLLIPISRDLLVMVVEFGVILVILTAILVVSILIAILVIRILSVLCLRRTAVQSHYRRHQGKYPQTFPHRFPPVLFPRSTYGAGALMLLRLPKPDNAGALPPSHNLLVV
jgi:hypothetical protein